MFNAGMTERAPHREAGFTLIEILVVMGILAVVLGVMIGRGPARSLSPPRCPRPPTFPS